VLEGVLDVVLIFGADNFEDEVMSVLLTPKLFPDV
jgi:hypothetical protein